MKPQSSGWYLKTVVREVERRTLIVMDEVTKPLEVEGVDSTEFDEATGRSIERSSGRLEIQDIGLSEMQLFRAKAGDEGIIDEVDMTEDVGTIELRRLDIVMPF
ncbi:hypothetical protein EG329_009704 [Mollisiaceae sp. DMI_Dod_QoI]|nr:hypothetical protein EG329_009704 [Helotiales sp. DMI_Dod_QoI]